MPVRKQGERRTARGPGSCRSRCLTAAAVAAGRAGRGGCREPPVRGLRCGASPPRGTVPPALSQARTKKPRGWSGAVPDAEACCVPGVRIPCVLVPGAPGSPVCLVSACRYPASPAPPGGIPLQAEPGGGPAAAKLHRACHQHLPK